MCVRVRACLIVCDLETSTMRRPRPDWTVASQKINITTNINPFCIKCALRQSDSRNLKAMGFASFDMKLTLITKCFFHLFIIIIIIMLNMSVHMHGESSHSFHVLNPASCGF